ncbi:trans-1,2-dihydrobenzene-1,2-diol dehydrogenase isoform X3 [Mustela nigripes]|uniref:trans-1,2-dihydrobenzene-1,2-diol dehydrogenase isoform X3 n=1 Tax=Mustela nigripes TaxID=77151 RepID=UPI002814BDCB|nr:trans-1,2-dihydrobenzene-1,2-diol dehydrogenase isoform X3 [Mustela nigripes]
MVKYDRKELRPGGMDPEQLPPQKEEIWGLETDVERWVKELLGDSYKPAEAFVSGLLVVAVAARDLSRAKEFARKHDIPKAYGSYEELAKDPNVEVAYIGTQQVQHKAAVLLCLAAGKAVLCEKPMGTNSAEVREMVAEARSRGLFLMEGIWTRFFPAIEALRSAVSQGALGSLRVARAEFGKDLTGIPRIIDKAQAGGALWTLVSTVSSSSPWSLVGRSLRRFQPWAGSMKQVLEPFWCPTELVVKGEHKEFPLPPTPGKEFNFPNGAGMVYEAKHVRECLRKGLKESPVMPLVESELLADILEEVRKAIGVTFP